MPSDMMPDSVQQATAKAVKYHSHELMNDTVNAAVIDRLSALGVRLVALRSAGYNNVDVRAAYGKVHVVHVPAYSPYSVAEHAMALLLTSVRRIHKVKAGKVIKDTYTDENLEVTTHF